jgi:hypothetical protein
LYCLKNFSTLVVFLIVFLKIFLFINF